MDRLDQIGIGFMEAKILFAAAELRVFDRIEERGSTADEIARPGGESPRAMRILLDALAAMEILSKDAGRYRVRPEYARRLREDSPVHYPAMLRHRNRMFRGWAFLEERMRDLPVPALGSDRATLIDPQTNENFIRAMYAFSHETVPLVVDRLELAGVRTVADVGGGPGHYLAEIARRSPGVEPHLIDLPLTLEVARKILSSSPVRERIRFDVWDFYLDPPPQGLPQFDLIFLSQVVHSESAESNGRLFTRLFPLVASGGRLVVHDRVVEDDRSRPYDAALFAVNMLALTPGGEVYTESEIQDWGRSAGFTSDPGERINERSYIVRFRKPTA